jgi:hypothetical protein
MTTTPPIACSLEGAELSDRAGWMRELGDSLVGIEADRGRARLRFEADRHPELEEFVRAESGCCSFFDFGLATENGTSELSIGAPEDAGWAVRGLVAGFVAGWGSLV